MEDYERRKLYLLHLKNVSQIQNGKNKKPYVSYSSRIFNQSSPNDWFRKSVQAEKLPPSTSRATREKQTKNLFVDQENLRLGARLLKIPSRIQIKKYLKEYSQHKKLMKLRSKFKPTKNEVLCKIYNITFKKVPFDPQQEYIVYDQCWKEELMRGTIFELRKKVLKFKKVGKTEIKIVGRMKGLIKLQEKEMIPIINKRQVVGTLILQIL